MNFTIVGADKDRVYVEKFPRQPQLCCSALAVTDMALGHLGLLENTQESESVNVFNLQFALAAAPRER